jgi:hypothetical protein
MSGIPEASLDLGLKTPLPPPTRVLAGGPRKVGFLAHGAAKPSFDYLSELDRSAIYMNTLPIFTLGRARLISIPRFLPSTSGHGEHQGRTAQRRNDNDYPN